MRRAALGTLRCSAAANLAQLLLGSSQRSARPVLQHLVRTLDKGWGEMAFEYRWDSSSGRKAQDGGNPDLSPCSLYEITTYADNPRLTFTRDDVKRPEMPTGTHVVPPHVSRCAFLPHGSILIRQRSPDNESIGRLLVCWLALIVHSSVLISYIRLGR